MNNILITSPFNTDKQDHKYVYGYFKGTDNFDRFCICTNVSENKNLVLGYLS